MLQLTSRRLGNQVRGACAGEGCADGTAAHGVEGRRDRGMGTGQVPAAGQLGPALCSLPPAPLAL